MRCDRELFKIGWISGNDNYYVQTRSLILSTTSFPINVLNKNHQIDTLVHNVTHMALFFPVHLSGHYPLFNLSYREKRARLSIRTSFYEFSHHQKIASDSCIL
jgi:hypothetical protein